LQRPSIASVMEVERPLVTPLAHDALSARLIARTGFRAFAVGGSALLATRFGLPDIGLIGLSDMTAGIRDIAAATELPFFADGDDGYGDVKSVARMIELYEHIGVSAILIEDQSRTTLEQLRTVGQMLRDRGLHSAVLVSDRTHMLRSLRIARDQGIEAYGSPTTTSPAASPARRAACC